MSAIKRHWTELRISTPLWVWIFPVLFSLSRITGTLDPKHLISFGEFAISLSFALLVYDLFSRETRWNTVEVTLAAPQRKSALLMNRLFYCAFWMIFTTFSLVSSEHLLTVLAPAVALGGAALFISLCTYDSWGIGTAIAWWGWSLVVATEGFSEGSSDMQSWFLVGLTQVGLTADEILIRKWAQAGVGILLLAFCLAVVDRKKNWDLG